MFERKNAKVWIGNEVLKVKERIRVS